MPLTALALATTLASAAPAPVHPLGPNALGAHRVDPPAGAAAPELGGLALASPSLGGFGLRGFALERVDLIAELPGTWINDDLPASAVNPAGMAVRLLEQVQVVVRMPYPGLSAGASIAAQSLYYEVPIPRVPGLAFTVGLQTRALLPVGVLASVSWRWWRLRFALGAVAATAATWRRVDYRHVYVLPTLGVGIGASRE